MGLKDIEILHERLWRYNIRYTPEQLRSGVPQAIDKAQGEGNVWYAGGALSHWNVDSITDGSHRLVGRFARKLGLPWRERMRLFRWDDLLRDL